MYTIPIQMHVAQGPRQRAGWGGYSPPHTHFFAKQKKKKKKKQPN